MNEFIARSQFQYSCYSRFFSPGFSLSSLSSFLGIVWFWIIQCLILVARYRLIRSENLHGNIPIAIASSNAAWRIRRPRALSRRLMIIGTLTSFYTIRWKTSANKFKIYFTSWRSSEHQHHNRCWYFNFYQLCVTCSAAD